MANVRQFAAADDRLPFPLLKAALLLLALILVACGGQSGPEPAAQETPAAGDGGIADTNDLLDALRAAGLDVTVTGPVDDPLFAAQAQAIDVGGAYVQIFEFESQEAAAEAASSVSGGGTIIGTTTVDWVEPPHFYRVGRLIVLHAGSDETLLDALAGVLGEPFLIGVAMGLPSAGE